MKPMTSTTTAGRSTAAVAPTFWDSFSAADVQRWTEDARQRTLELVEDLDDEQLLGPRVATVNPLLWEIGHVAWFHEKWILRHPHQGPSLLPQADALYDSMAIPHDARWDLPLLTCTETLRYMQQVHEQVLARLEQHRNEEQMFLHLMALFHEDMHNEAFVINRQTLAYPRPWFHIPADAGVQDRDMLERAPCSGFVDIPGGEFLLGASPNEPFVFDNEKWQHTVEVEPFAIARAPVRQAEFAAFVDDGGYERRELWGAGGWQWRQKAQARHPVYWDQRDGQWLRRDFDTWVSLEPHRPVINICSYEAEAYCSWAGCRLPTEAEWEAAASLDESYNHAKRRFPWGDGSPTARKANLDGYLLGCVDVNALPEGDSPLGCRQIIGNVWEWTASDFLPYPGFVPDPYKEYSQPWFGDHKVLRGGSWLTRGRMIRNTWRNFYQPDRRDVWAGFRTCRRES